MTYGVIHWWVIGANVDVQTESALVARLHELNVTWADRSPGVMTLRFTGTPDDAQEAWQALLTWLGEWRHVVGQQFAADFHAILVATLPNAFGEL